jgi:PhnB protein
MTTLTPYIVVDDAADAIEFYRRIFGAEVEVRMDGPDGGVFHASLVFGDSRLMLSDELPRAPYHTPGPGHRPSSGLYVYVDDVDAVYEAALQAGATGQVPPDDMFWGDRWCRIEDPYGHLWEIATRVEDVGPDELASRGRAATSGGAT